MRSTISIDLGALRRNAAQLIDALDGAELWAVVKADAYGHGALDSARAALDAGARSLCVATVAEGIALRRDLRDSPVLVMGPHSEDELRPAREARLELAISQAPVPEDIPVHLKLDTGMGRFGFDELPDPPPNTVALMTHFATADSDPTFAEEQLARFHAATDRYDLPRHAANSAAALRLPGSRLDAVRCGIALYGLSPFGTDPSDDGLEPVLSWRSELARVTRLEPGASTGYGRRFVAEKPTWIGIVPVGYADGFRRDLTGTEVLVDGELCRAVGTVSMDSFAVVLPSERPVGAAVTLIGDGLYAEEHARVAETINYELTCGINSDGERAHREAVGA